jgi:hypothetical protein
MMEAGQKDGTTGKLPEETVKDSKTHYREFLFFG